MDASEPIPASWTGIEPVTGRYRRFSIDAAAATLMRFTVSGSRIPHATAMDMARAIRADQLRERIGDDTPPRSAPVRTSGRFQP